MIGLALSGGGSRAMAFHLGCLRALNDLGILNSIGVLSTISGGSVIGAYYAYTPDKSFEEFELDIRNALRMGFHRKIAVELAKPNNLFSCLTSLLVTRVEELAARLMKRKPQLCRYPSRTDMFCKILSRDLFYGQTMSSPRRNDIEIVIGSCELGTGSAFRFGNRKSGSWRQGEMSFSDVDIALAVAASAAYPVFFPAVDRIWRFRKRGQETQHRVFLTDGGVYDNLGIQVLEPGRDPEVSLHTFPCDYLIGCNAGHGQMLGRSLSIRFLPRIIRSFEVIHRRVQDSTMHRLHHLKEVGQIRGFALPYLGQLDERLPWRPSVLVPREEVINYPTDFASMSDQWIDRLSDRGEHLTRILVSYYLPDLLDDSTTSPEL